MIPYAAMETKTNVMRTLDKAKITYKTYNYTPTGSITGAEAAEALGKDPACVFKTLVTVGKTGAHYVFMIPVLKELNLKRCASAVGEKSVEMIKSKELLPLTGYVHGGCSPIGMKKQFVTVLDSSALDFDTIVFSAGKIGCQIELSPNELKKVVDYKSAAVTE